MFEIDTSRVEKVAFLFFGIGILPWCYLVIFGLVRGLIQKGEKIKEILFSNGLMGVSLVQSFIFVFGFANKIDNLSGGIIIFIHFLCPIIIAGVFWGTNALVFSLPFLLGGAITASFSTSKKDIKKINKKLLNGYCPNPNHSKLRSIEKTLKAGAFSEENKG